MIKLHHISAILLTLLIIACSSDDNADTTSTPDEAIGSYTLSAVNVTPAQDVNEDGSSSTNLLDEMSCLNGTLTLNADTSWSLNLVRLNVTSITGGQFFIECSDSDSSSGTWTNSNGQINLNGSFEPTVYLLSDDTLTRQLGDELPGFQSIVFVKQ